MAIRFVFLVFLGFLFSNTNQAQISPGKLIAGHEHLEGISNCFKCHEIGSKVSNEKCLDCHKDINTRVSKGLGYHNSKEVKGKSCAECHSDHHGRNFKIINFNEDQFDHRLTGYELEGAHKEVDCRKCHTADLVKDAELKKRINTFLGLGDDCLSCHEDFHQNTLDKDCLKCHNMEKFIPAPAFDHNDTNFPLKGQHKDVDCRECHDETRQNGKEFTRFSGVAHQTCVNCHQDVHNGSLGADCISCHSENTFHTLTGRFNHNTTDYPLEGKHARLDCFSCHKRQNDLKNLFGDFATVDIQSCVSCHEDVHQNKFGQNCKECHTVESFRIKQNPDAFDHDLTGFMLEGKHADVECRLCHAGNMTDPVAHDQCKDCHEDHHNGEFTDNGATSDCRFCHEVNGFAPSTYSIEQHANNNFPLEGAHVATPCIFCHMKNDTWKFSSLGTKCLDCHTDIHEEYLDKSYYPDGDCRNCHTTGNWQESLFDHDKTSFGLLGKHQNVDCKNCHKPDKISADLAASPVFNVSSFCSSCHDDQHRAQFQQNENETDCSRCHESFGWEATNFNHDSTRFELDGVHAELECGKCHNSITDEKGIYVLYKLDKTQCSDCH